MRKGFTLFATLLCGALLLTSCGEKKQANQTSEAQAVDAKNDAYVYYAADLEKSTIDWEGTKPAGKHNGKLSFEEASLAFSKVDGMLSGGSFVADLTTINCEDLEGEMKAQLESHLKSEDFFHVEKYPTARFEITKVAKAEGDSEGKFEVTGNMTIKETTLSISFLSEFSLNPESNEFVFSTDKIVLDRTKWGVNYGSKNIFKELKDKFIDDEMTIWVSIKGAVQ